MDVSILELIGDMLSKNSEECLKLFLTVFILNLLSFVLLIIPLLGVILWIFVCMYLLQIIPIGVYHIHNNEEIEINDLLKECWEFYTKKYKMKREFLKGCLLTLSCVLIGVLLSVLLSFFALNGGSFSLAIACMIVSGLSYFILLTISVLIISNYSVKLNKKIIAQHLGEDGIAYIEKYDIKYPYEFIWLMCPILGMFWQFYLTERFIRKYEKNKQGGAYF